MKKKYVALMAGVAASMAIAAPMAMAAEVPGFPGAEPNGGQCSVEPGAGEASSNVPAFTPPALPALADTNAGNCESFGNDQHNGEYSGQDFTQGSVPEPASS